MIPPSCERLCGSPMVSTSSPICPLTAFAMSFADFCSTTKYGSIKSESISARTAMRIKLRARSEDSISAAARARGEWKGPAKPTRTGMRKSWRRPARYCPLSKRPLTRRISPMRSIGTRADSQIMASRHDLVFGDYSLVTSTLSSSSRRYIRPLITTTSSPSHHPSAV